MKKNKNKSIGLLFGSEFFKIGKNTITTEAKVQVTAVAKIIYEGSQISAAYDQIVDPKVAPKVNININKPVNIKEVPAL